MKQEPLPEVPQPERFEDIDEAMELYQAHKKMRMSAQEKELEWKENVISRMKGHQLTSYKNEDHCAELTDQTSLKVKDIDDDPMP